MVRSEALHDELVISVRGGHDRIADQPVFAIRPLARSRVFVVNREEIAVRITEACERPTNSDNKSTVVRCVLGMPSRHETGTDPGCAKGASVLGFAWPTPGHSR